MFREEEREQGAVSAFLIMIFAAVFAFVALFIDYGRMAALQAESETALHAAVRSVLSSYDQELMEEYGLFAVGSTDSSYIMSKVLQEGFDYSARQDRFTLMGAKLDSSELLLSRPLGTYPVFKQQIREQMKYKAPVNLVLELLNKFKPVSEVLKEASNTTDVLSKLQKLYDQREELIDKVSAGQKAAQQNVKAIREYTADDQAQNAGMAKLDEALSSMQDAVSQYGEYQSMVETDRNREPEDQLYTSEIYRYRSGASRIFNSLSDALRKSADSHQELVQNSPGWIREAADLNAQMEQVIQESEERATGANYDSVSNSLSTAGASRDQTAGGAEINKIREQTRSLLREDGFFEGLTQTVHQQIKLFDLVRSKNSALSGQQGAVLAGSSDAGAFRSSAAAAEQSLDAYIGQTTSDLEQEEQEIMQQRAHEGEIKSTEAAAKGKLKEAKNLIGKLSDLKNSYKQQQAQFDTLEDYYRDNLAFNSESGKTSGDESTVIDDDIYDSGSGSMKEMDQFYGVLSSILSGIADNGLETEYAADYFKAFDVTELTSFLDSGGSGEGKTSAKQSNNADLPKSSNRPDQAASGDLFSPERQEMEYILYGFHNPGGNLAAAFGEIFTMRLAIRTMEGFVVNANKGHPLLILASALLYGAKQALADMLTLIRTGSVPLSRYVNVSLSYQDHLRIFMLVHGSSNKRLSRMLALIRMNTGINPQERATYAEGEATTRMPLLFLPGISAAMNKAYSGQDKIEGSSYFVVKNAADSY
ncbi:hypothetical protein [Paenibacillus physcomitrellae]|uniref:Flp pilus-assembly TadG-like N-terminal domain-containing protein n=1 Tax=Paenibacillus physcomitrellae TaxID=1619311 RepID=A0ABQ1G5T8_9BACL|nr:hypothetical protein [Paenibacillus physcomitrellae]GGA37357.1 hypothetical protein GCM10010917_23160 [Paenibacillus physcomitrellae]